MVYISENYEIYAFVWDDVFKSFELRHSFLLDKLNYNKETIIKEIETMKDGNNREAADKLTKSIIP